MPGDDAERGRVVSRLEYLSSQGVLAVSEYRVATDALLGAMDNLGEGRAIRVEAYRYLAPSSGGPFLVIDVLTKVRLFKYDWGRLALHLDSEDLQARLLGLPYGSAAKRWDELLEKLEQLARMRQDEHLSDDQFLTVKYGILGRLGWLDLVGELVWLFRTVHGREGWWREDGWYVSDEAVDELNDWLMRSTPYETSPVREERIHHYFDWIRDRCWHHWNRIIAEGDIRYLRYQGVQRADDGTWSFG